MIYYRLKVNVVWLASLLIISLLAPFSAFQVCADEFDDIMAKEMNSFDQEKEFKGYSDKESSEFETYKRIVDSEFKRYKSEILRHWNKAEVSGKKKFVEYSPDYKIKKVVDFENQIININLIVPKSENRKSIDDKINRQLKDLINETNKTAFKRDKVIQNVEKKLNKKITNLKKAPINDLPIITDIITGSVKPSGKLVDKAVKNLRNSEKRTVKPSLKSTQSDIVTVTIKLPSDSMAKKAKTYLTIVKKYARKRNVDPALLLAVIQTESAFNPMARSYVPAYGLMQIVPRSAGLDASEVVLGKATVLSPSYLYNGENNINIGSAYLNILNSRYLKTIKNDTSRLYCVIAAYNTGAGNVARAFTGRTNIRKAAKKINTMSPDTVYRHLVRKLPHAETKRYMKNITQRMKLYK